MVKTSEKQGRAPSLRLQAIDQSHHNLEKAERLDRSQYQRYQRVSESLVTDLIYDHLAHNLSPADLSKKYPVKLITIYKILQRHKNHR